MKIYQTQEIKNIALLGNDGSGKTTLTESMLYEAGIIQRRGRITQHNTVSDYFPVEQEYGYSVFSTVFHVEWNGKKLRIKDKHILIIEGIHALNPRLTENIPDSNKYKIYTSALTNVSLDDHNWIPTRDNRLLRRIIRDYNKGAFSARETIKQWPNVCAAEEKWIFPYQENADVMFNSALNIEFAILRNHAEPILRSVPKNCPEYAEAHRLLKFIHYFTPVSDKEIPPTSIMREFVGGSSFKY